MTIGEREAQDLQRGRQYIADARPRVQVSAPERLGDPGPESQAPTAPSNLTDVLFGPYTCPRCCSYLHLESDHGTGRG